MPSQAYRYLGKPHAKDLLKKYDRNQAIQDAFKAQRRIACVIFRVLLRNFSMGLSREN